MDESIEQESEENIGLIDRALKKMMPESIDTETKIREMLE